MLRITSEESAALREERFDVVSWVQSLFFGQSKSEDGGECRLLTSSCTIKREEDRLPRFSLTELIVAATGDLLLFDYVKSG